MAGVHDYLGMLLDPGFSDFTRDTLSAIVGGLVLMGIGGVLAYFRIVRSRLNRHGIEIRHTQNSVDPKVEPFFKEYPGDKL